MKISRTKFVILFLAFAFAFTLISTAALDMEPASIFGSSSQEGWKSTVANILSPIRLILVGPLIPFINFLQQDPDAPPPFFLIGFAIYWTLLAICIHYARGKIRNRKTA